MLTIGIADDHRLFRKSLALLVGTFKDVKIIVEADNGMDFIDELLDNPVDIALLDIQMPGMSGYDVCRDLLEVLPNTKILMISQLASRETIQQVMECGAHGFLSKNCDPAELETALRNLQDSGFYLGRELTLVLEEATITDKKPVQRANPELKLTNREIDVLKLTAKELNTHEIADKLKIHPRTVETHRNNMIIKTESRNFIGVLLFGFKNNIININDVI